MGGANVKLGVTFPQLDFGAGVGDRAAIRAYAQAAQDLGYDYLLAYDHVLSADDTNRPGWSGYTHRDPFHEPFTLFAFMAAVAPDLEFVPGVIILPQRQTALVAKQAAEVDILTGGKFRLGIGVGWNAVEFEGLNERFDNRGKRIEEQIALLRRLWTEPVFTYRGEHHTVTEAGLNPLPIQRPIPIWIGGTADVVLERCGRLGDGWFPLGRVSPEVEAQIERLREHTAAAGRPVDAVGIDARIDMRSTPEAEWGIEIERWRAAGATHLSINTMYQGYSPAEHIAAIARFKAVATG
jgi:probable F420-dependent oxidoreductase